MSATRGLPTSMIAWQHHPTLFSAGPFPQVLRLNQIAAAPQLKAKQTLVKVLTAGLNPVDYKLGSLPVVTRLALGSPSTPGIDYVGRVWATNLPDSSGIKAGDLVYGATTGTEHAGTLAGFTIITDPEGLAKVPQQDHLELDWFAGIGVAGLTAYTSLIPELETSGPGSARGKSVFINGGSGGVGTFGVQIAKAIGCEKIVVTCSAVNADLVKSLGATEVIDYRSVDIAEAAKSWVTSQNDGKPFDLIVDNAGADFNLYWQCHNYLVPGGKYVFVGADISFRTLGGISKIMMWPTMLGGGKRKFAFLALKANRAGYERIGEWMKEGKVKCIVDSTWPMEQVKEAYEKLKTGRARGKVLVRVSEDGRGTG